jgi:hypothetical protein
VTAGEPLGVDSQLVSAKPALRALGEFLLSPGRDVPVVGISAAAGQREPLVDPGLVREIVGPAARIYVLAGDYMLRGLEGRLGGKLALKAEAIRVWWPGLSARSDPRDHPLVMTLSDEPQHDTLRELEREFHLSHPVVRREVRVTENALALAERQLTEAVSRERESASANTEAERERDRAARAAEEALAALAAATRELEEMDCEERLHAVISREWRALTASDRREHPLSGYVLTPKFVESVEKLGDPSPDRVGWVCAMVACGYAQALTGLALHPLVRGRATQQFVRADDGAKGWRCNLKRNAPGGARLHYWVRKNGVYEFDSVGTHDELTAK